MDDDDRDCALVRQAARLSWSTPGLREMLRFALERRGVAVGRFDSCGDIASALERMSGLARNARPSDEA